MKATDYRIKQRVICPTNQYGDAIDSPMWNGTHGRIVGTVDKIDMSQEYPIWIKWDNGKRTGYKGDLPFVSYHVGEDIAFRIWDHIKPYKYIIGFIAIILVFEIFILKGKTFNLIKSIAEKFVDRVFGSVNKAIDDNTGG